MQLLHFEFFFVEIALQLGDLVVAVLHGLFHHPHGRRIGGHLQLAVLVHHLLVLELAALQRRLEFVGSGPFILPVYRHGEEKQNNDKY